MSKVVTYHGGHSLGRSPIRAIRVCIISMEEKLLEADARPVRDSDSDKAATNMALGAGNAAITARG